MDAHTHAHWYGILLSEVCGGLSLCFTFAVSVELKLERPVKVSLCHDTLSQVTSFLELVSPTLHQDNTETASGAAGVRLHQDTSDREDGIDRAAPPAWLAGKGNHVFY